MGAVRDERLVIRGEARAESVLVPSKALKTYDKITQRTTLGQNTGQMFLTRHVPCGSPTGAALWPSLQLAERGRPARSRHTRACAALQSAPERPRQWDRAGVATGSENLGAVPLGVAQGSVPSKRGPRLPPPAGASDVAAAKSQQGWEHLCVAPSSLPSSAGPPASLPLPPEGSP